MTMDKIFAKLADEKFFTETVAHSTLNPWTFHNWHRFNISTDITDAFHYDCPLLNHAFLWCVDLEVGVGVAQLYSRARTLSLDLSSDCTILGIAIPGKFSILHKKMNKDHILRLTIVLCHRLQ